MIRKEDNLWKAIIEDFAVDFISFTLPDAHKILNLQQTPEFLDKELEQVHIAENAHFTTKIVDKLIKVYTHKGGDDCLLVHVEVQAKYNSEVEGRMMTYFSRIREKYQLPVTAIVVYTEASRKARPQTYVYECMGTSLTYKFNVYKISDQTDRELITHSNPFALVIMAARIESTRRKIKEPEQRDNYAMTKKIDLIKLLISKKLNKQNEIRILKFIHHYIHLENENIKVNFAIEVDKLTNFTNIMGIEETIISMAKEEAMLEGRQKGMLQGILEGKLEGKLEEALAIAIKMRQKNMDIDLIAEVTNIPVTTILQINA